MIKKLITLIMVLLFLVVGLVACNNAASLADYKAQAKAELDAYAVQADYSEANRQAVLDIIASGKTAIDEVTDKVSVDAIKATLIMAIDEISPNEVEVKHGTYTTDDEMASVILFGDNQFIFDRHPVASYAPTGNYSISDGELLLRVNDDEIYVFIIKKECLEFKSGELAQNLVENGTTFYYEITSNR